LLVVLTRWKVKKSEKKFLDPRRRPRVFLCLLLSQSRQCLPKTVEMN
jgi:hypothetical protein